MAGSFYKFFVGGRMVGASVEFGLFKVVLLLFTGEEVLFRDAARGVEETMFVRNWFVDLTEACGACSNPFACDVFWRAVGIGIWVGFWASTGPLGHCR